MLQNICDFRREEGGQDLVEYSLLMALVGLGAALVFLGAGRNVTGIWKSANTVLVTANTTAS